MLPADMVKHSWMLFPTIKPPHVLRLFGGIEIALELVKLWPKCGMRTAVGAGQLLLCVLD